MEPSIHTDPEPFGIDLLWLPLGVRGRWLLDAARVYEAVCAFIMGRLPLTLYHSVLDIRAREGRFIAEMGPVVDRDGWQRGVVGEGAVGVGWAKRFRVCRYELRLWRDGTTAIRYAVGGPQAVVRGADLAHEAVQLVRGAPTPVWGRHWTCNSLTAWVLGRLGLEGRVAFPEAGRAPGWEAGLRLARRGERGSAPEVSGDPSAGCERIR